MADSFFIQNSIIFVIVLLKDSILQISGFRVTPLEDTKNATRQRIPEFIGLTALTERVSDGIHLNSACFFQ